MSAKQQCRASGAPAAAYHTAWYVRKASEVIPYGKGVRAVLVLLAKERQSILSSGSSSWFGVSEPRNSVAPLEVTVKFPLMVYISGAYKDLGLDVALAALKLELAGSKVKYLALDLAGELAQHNPACHAVALSVLKGNIGEL